MKSKIEIKNLCAGVFVLIIVGISLTLIHKFVKMGMPYGIILKGSEEWIQENMPFREELFELNGLYKKTVGKDDVKKGTQTYIKLENGQMAYLAEKVDMSNNIKQLKDFSDFCQEHDMQFMYVNFPAKPFSDSELADLGYETYANENVDSLLNGLTENKVKWLDIRESIVEKERDFYSLFYRTDHHWNVDGGLFAAQEIIDELNSEFGYNFERALLEEDKFERKVYEKCWLGEVGRVVSKTFAGLDDFILMTPIYSTSMRYDVDESNKHLEGDFSVMLDTRVYNNLQNDLYKTSWHYSYLYVNYGRATITNQNKQDMPKILMIKDSFALVVAPYMALNASEVTLWDMRYNEENLKEYILNNDFDIVIVTYTQTSLKKEKMFDFLK